MESDAAIAEAVRLGQTSVDMLLLRQYQAALKKEHLARALEMVGQMNLQQSLEGEEQLGGSRWEVGRSCWQGSSPLNAVSISRLSPRYDTCYSVPT